MTTHYTAGLDFFHHEFIPQVKARLADLSGGVWSFANHVAYAAGSDVDFMAHIVEAMAARGRVCLYPGDWFGFRVGCTQTDRIVWDSSGAGDLACLCVPSVRNGHLTDDMVGFLDSAPACLLNINLYPTLNPIEREQVAARLLPVLDKAIVSISFSRGFGLTASQLGVVLVPADHPLRSRYETQWNWFTYFHNALAALAFLAFDLSEQQRVDRARATWVQAWLEQHGLPTVTTGSYYVKAFEVNGEVPAWMAPLRRGGLIRLCFKPPQTE
ncbi:MAG: hypothetical protein JSS02_02965 [Planctomycetes bacterium]|nr:hypothetical protein [Planctomycetota bacterium]